MNVTTSPESEENQGGSTRSRAKALVVAALAVLLVASAQLACALEREGASGEKKFALVIGNGHYKSSPLKNPVNDARAMAATLQSFGFEVVLQENASYKDMRRAIIEFGNRLRDGGVGVFYYAGHGLQVSGHNYMVPVDAVIQGDSEVAVEAVDVDYVLSRMETARNRLNIVILDACRDDPYSRSFRSEVHGLASIDAPEGTLIAYATAPGKVAKDADGDGPNGLYTSELLKAMRVPGLKIEDIFKQVRKFVSQKTKGQQVPWEASSLTGDFSFAVPPSASSAASRVERPMTPRPETREEAPRVVGSEASNASDELERAKQYMRSSNPGAALPLLREAVRKNSAEAMGLLGNLYAYGSGVPRDQAEAVRWYLKASEGGSITAMREVGFMYQNGSGVTKDYAEALRWYRKSAGAGNAVAMNDIGLMYLNGWGVTKDEAEALRWFRKSADAGNEIAMRNVGLSYHHGWGAAKDEAEAARWFRKGAEAGNAVAARELGLQYLNGWGVTQDYAEAVRWARKSADAGDIEAMNDVGFAYANGRGVTKDAAEAARWYRKAADGGNALAMHNLGTMYLDGSGVAKDEAEAVLWFRKGAEAGNDVAMNSLGVVYANGRGVAKDEAEAVRWYRMSAEAGNALAMRNLGLMYASGWGIAKDEAEAVVWIRKSAEAGDVLSMRVLGTMYQNGVGVAVDQAEAVKWYQRGALLGDKASVERLNSLSKSR
jgi:TPR repeat protein